MLSTTSGVDSSAPCPPDDAEEFNLVRYEALGIQFWAAIAPRVWREVDQRYGPIGVNASSFESDLIGEIQAEWIAWPLGTSMRATTGRASQ